MHRIVTFSTSCDGSIRYGDAIDRQCPFTDCHAISGKKFLVNSLIWLLTEWHVRSKVFYEEMASSRILFSIEFPATNNLPSRGGVHHYLSFREKIGPFVSLTKNPNQFSIFYIKYNNEKTNIRL